jgi:hypothetical protein
VDYCLLTVDSAHANVLHTCLFGELDAVARPETESEVDDTVPSTVKPVMTDKSLTEAFPRLLD